MGAAENKTLLSFIMKLFPKSRWGNVAYLIVGFAVANYDEIVELIEKLFP